MRRHFLCPLTASFVAVLATAGVSSAADPLPSARTIHLPLAARALVYDPGTRRLFAVTGSRTADPSRANSITPIDPITGQLGTSVFVGENPGPALTLSDGGKYLYIAVSDRHAVRRYEIATGRVEDPFPLGNDGDRALSAEAMMPVPGDPESVAVLRVTRTSPGDQGVAVYTNGKVLPGIARAGYRIAPDIVPGRWWGYNSREPSCDLSLIVLSPRNGATFLGTAGGGVVNGDLALFSAPAVGLLVTDNGLVVDPHARRSLGRLSGTGLFSRLCPDPERGRVFQVAGGKEGTRIIAYNLHTLARIGVVALPDIKARVFGNVGSEFANLVRWGEAGLAFTTETGEVVLTRLDLGPKLPTPDLEMTRTPLPIRSRRNSPFDYTLTVTNRSTVATATGVALSEELPAGSDVANISPSQGTATMQAGVIQAALGSLAPGASATVTVRISLASVNIDPNSTFYPAFLPRPMQNLAVLRAVVRADQPDPVPANNSAELDLAQRSGDRGGIGVPPPLPH